MFKPMLAGEVDLAKLKYPCAASPKLDGCRAVVIDGVVMSRKLKPIPNRYVQSLFGKPEFEGYDGELICGSPTDPDLFRNTQSAVMSEDGEPDAFFLVFDNIRDTTLPWRERYKSLVSANRVVKVPHRLVPSERELLALQDGWVSRGFEGVMVRAIEGRYKFGRSTTNEGLLLKLKTFCDAEFKVVGVQERMRNENEATIDELGHTKRSSHKENKVGRGDLGALVLEGPCGTFTCGTGFTDSERASLWVDQQKLIGRWAKVKYFSGGMKDAPRFPVFLGFREEMDR